MQAFVGSTVSLRAPGVKPSGGAVRSVTCMAKKKGVRRIITLECTEAKEAGASPSRYTTQKNTKNTPERLELMKYNPFMRKMTLHRELKK